MKLNLVPVLEAVIMNELDLNKQIRRAIQDGEVERLAALIADDQNRLNAMTPFGSWLHVAADASQLEVVKLLVSKGIDVNRRGGILGGGALNLAASGGFVEIVEFLLSHGAEMDTSDPRFNPLFAAIYGGHPNIARVLIENGIDTGVKYSGSTMKDMDARAFAIERGQTTIAEMLADFDHG
jgi:uncharacterized protein